FATSLASQGIVRTNTCCPSRFLRTFVITVLKFFCSTCCGDTFLAKGRLAGAFLVGFFFAVVLPFEVVLVVLFVPAFGLDVFLTAIVYGAIGTEQNRVIQ